MAVTESQLVELLQAWSDPLPVAPDRLAAVERRIRRHRSRVRLGSAAAVCALVAVGALVAGYSGATRDHSPAVRRGPSHPALLLTSHYAGSNVSGQVSGVGAQTRSTTLVWPQSARLGLVVQCSAGEGFAKISVVGEADPLRTSCAAPGASLLVDAGSYFPHVPAGSLVTFTVSTDAGVEGPWVVGVLDRDPRWLGGGTAAPTFHGQALQHWVSGGISSSTTVKLTAADARPVFVLTCGQPGRLSLLLDGHDVGTVECADAAWSQQVLQVSQRSLATAGYLPGRTVSVAFGWEGTASWAYVGFAQYTG